MPGYFAVVPWVLVALLLVASVTLRIVTDYTSDRYGLSEPRHSSPTQSLATAPPSAPDTMSKAVLAAQPAAQAAPESPAQIESVAQAAPEIPAQIEPAAEAPPEGPAQIQSAAEVAPEIPAQ